MGCIDEGKEPERSWCWVRDLKHAAQSLASLSGMPMAAYQEWNGKFPFLSIFGPLVQPLGGFLSAATTLKAIMNGGQPTQGNAFIGGSTQWGWMRAGVVAGGDDNTKRGSIKRLRRTSANIETAVVRAGLMKFLWWVRKVPSSVYHLAAALLLPAHRAAIFLN